jgi:uncharacterized protein (TIGR03437 family)
MAFQRLLFAVAVLGVQGAFAQTLADFFDNTVLHRLDITMAAADWASLKLHYLDNTYYNVTSMKWQGGGSLTASVSNFQLRSRGHGSRSPIKPGLHLDFTKITSTQRFLGMTEVELKNNSQDPSMIHELISFELFARMGTPVSRVAPSRLYVNGEYIGLYNICESPADSNYLQRNFNETGGYVYEYKPNSWVNPTDPQAGYHFEYLGSNLDTYSGPNGNVPFDPKTHSNAPDTVTIEKLIRTMNQASDADFIPLLTAEPNAGPLIDPNQFLTQVATETWLADFDCILGDIFGLNNFFWYRMSKSQFTNFMAWDKDNAFDWTQRPILQNAGQNVLMRRLIAIPQYKQFYFDMMEKVAMLAGGDGGWVQSEASRFYALIKQAAYDDPNKTYLDSGNLLLSTNDKFDASVALVQAFPKDRASFVLQDLAKNGYQPPSSYPTLAAGGIVNAAAFAAPASGGLASIYGSNFGDAKSTQVYIDGFAAPLSFASPGQLNVQTPWEAGGFSTFGVLVNGAPSNILFNTVNTYSPGIFVITHQNGTLVNDAGPATVGETLVVYATGLGPVNGPMVTGQPASNTTLEPTNPQATAKLNSITAPVVFSGLTPGFIGLYQVNVTVPPGVSGTAFLDLSIGGATAPSVNFPVK